jgi:hypothetical protein
MNDEQIKFAEGIKELILEIDKVKECEYQKEMSHGKETERILFKITDIDKDTFVMPLPIGLQNEFFDSYPECITDKIEKVFKDK